MILEEFFEATLQDMTAMRMALGHRFFWFTHLTQIENAQSIRTGGLIPKSHAGLPREVLAILGSDAANIICLNPLGSEAVGPPVQTGKRICLAICRNALPKRIGLDWSYGSMVNRAHGYWQAQPAQSKSVAQAFVDVVASWGSVVSYDLIPPEALRVLTKDTPPNDINRWPFLISTKDEQLHVFPHNCHHSCRPQESGAEAPGEVPKDLAK